MIIVVKELIWLSNENICERLIFCYREPLELLFKLHDTKQNEKPTTDNCIMLCHSNVITLC